MLEFTMPLSGDALRNAKAIDIVVMNIQIFAREPSLAHQKEALDWVKRLPGYLEEFGEAWRKEFPGQAEVTLRVHLQYPDDKLGHCAWCRDGYTEVVKEDQVIEFEGHTFRLLDVPMKRCTRDWCGKGAFNLEVLNPLEPALKSLVAALNQGRDVKTVELDPELAELVVEAKIA